MYLIINILFIGSRSSPFFAVFFLFSGQGVFWSSYSCLDPLCYLNTVINQKINKYQDEKR